MLFNSEDIIESIKKNATNKEFLLDLVKKNSSNKEIILEVIKIDPLYLKYVSSA